jgi:uncharacterized protein
MMVRFIAHTVGAAAIACLALSQAAQAQQKPPAAGVTLATQLLATELLKLKGGIGAYDPAIDGVVIHHKGVLLQINPNLAKDINDVEQMMRKEGAARREELHKEIALGYASAFTEQELKDMIAFYQTPLGKKMIEQEPKAGEESTKRAQVWIDKYAETVIAKMRAEMRKRGHNEF